MAIYVPERGDIVRVNFDPQSGHEQAGRRPAIILSPVTYNKRVGLALLCPITSRIKGYPFEVSIPKGFATTGVILADQLKSFDWSARQVEFLHKVPETTLAEVLRKLHTLLTIQK
jgi:mRNA interferase MazF